MWDHLKETDEKAYEILELERNRQEEGLELIASENFVSPSVMEAAGSLLTNKYAEGYPNKRYYGGCKIVDMAESLARNRAKDLFNAKYVNVQPHSGSQANMTVYFAFLKPGDKIMGMSLSEGGTSDSWFARIIFQGYFMMLLLTVWMKIPGISIWIM